MAQRPCPSRSFGYPHELFDVTVLVIEPEVSKATKKYGFDDAGQSAGFPDKHDAGSPSAGVDEVIATAAIAAPRTAVTFAPRKRSPREVRKPLVNIVLLFPAGQYGRTWSTKDPRRDTGVRT